MKAGHEHELLLSLLLAAYLAFGSSPTGRVRVAFHSVMGVIATFTVALTVLNTFGVVPGVLALMTAYVVSLNGNAIFAPARASPTSDPVELTQEERTHSRAATLEEEMVSMMAPIVPGTDRASFKPVQADGVPAYEIQG